MIFSCLYSHLGYDMSQITSVFTLNIYGKSQNLHDEVHFFHEKIWLFIRKPIFRIHFLTILTRFMLYNPTQGTQSVPTFFAWKKWNVGEKVVSLTFFGWDILCP